MKNPLQFYTGQKDKLNIERNKCANRLNRVATARLGVFIAMVTVGIYVANSAYNSVLWLSAAGLFFVFVVLVWRNYLLRELRDAIDLRLKMVDNEMNALEGNYSAFPDGLGYHDAGHPYSYDLDVFGKHSLFQMLCRCVTRGGERLLASDLRTLRMSAEQIKNSQGVIQELSTQPDLLLQFRVAGMAFNEEPNDQNRFTTWLLEDHGLMGDKLLMAAVGVMPALSLFSLVYCFYVGGIFWGLPVVVVINLVVQRAYLGKMKSAAERLTDNGRFTRKYEHLLRLFAVAQFENKILQDTSQMAKDSVAQIARLTRLVNLFESRKNNMVGPLMNALFLFNITCVLRLEKWRQENRELMSKAMHGMISMDASISYATYAFNNPDYVYPQINEGRTVISAADLKHPLLSKASSVGNSFTLGNEEQFYLLTGANMTGKSTFMRTVGVCHVLFTIGLPLPAQEASFPLVQLYTSMRVTDSVQDDISYFKAELNRIKNMMKVLREGFVPFGGIYPFLVLLDEPLRGTNSADKQQGTRSIVERLLKEKAIGVVATHDTILCKMEHDLPGKVNNYHFESAVGAEGLVFDFILKRGPSTSNNATILMKQMGIIDS